MRDVLDLFHGETRIPAQTQIDWLTKRQGVPNLALGQDGDRGGYGIGTANVKFDAGWFDMGQADEKAAKPALIFVARDSAGDSVDLVAWSPRDGTVARYFGRVTALGEHDLLAPRGDDPLPVHRDILGWLKAGRNGVVILAESGIWRVLDGMSLLAADVDHGLKLRQQLAKPEPRILVPTSEMRAAA